MIREMHALLPRLISEVGHIFHYHLFVQKAAHSLGWSYMAYVPQKTRIAPLPPLWKAILANDLSEKPKGFWQKIYFLGKNIAPFRKIFRSLENNESALVFIEHFEFHHLVSLMLALSFLKPTFHFWILHRYELENRKLKAFAHRLFLAYMSKKLGKDKVRCLTDSELLSLSLTRDLGRSVSLVPIPHTEKKEKKREAGNEIVRFWWPGGLIREEKGLSKIRNLLALIQDRKDIRFVVAEEAKGALGLHPHIEFIPTSLTREEYVKWMQRSDLILLPYSEKDYSQRTSGIFVEAISLGTMPLTTKGTWMAYELSKFHLPELIFDWSEPHLIEQILSLLSAANVREKLKVMRAQYQYFHGLSGFASALKQIEILMPSFPIV